MVSQQQIARWPIDVTELFVRFCCWTPILLSLYCTWHFRGYWSYGNLIDWLIGRPINALSLLSSVDDRILLWILSSAVSVEWHFLHADTKWFDVFELFICQLRWLSTTFSTVLERKLRLDIGHNDVPSVTSALPRYFYGNGVGLGHIDP